jgi:4-amino-4-deoxy-L-arabinose transferase-like glycosyltransferase
VRDREVRRDAALLCLFAAALVLPALGGHDLWNPNEPIYGQAVVEMSRTGDLLVPHVNGLVFPEKPILYYWLALAASKLSGGVSEAALRLPSALAGIFSVGALYFLCRRYATPSRARIAAVLLATTHMMFLGSRTAQMDILVEASTLAVILCWDVSLGTACLAGIAAGLGFLAKGPVGWICPALVLVAYAIATKRVRALFSRGTAVAAIVAVAVPLPWLAALVLRGETEFLREMLFRQNVTRFVEAWDHQAPWWYFLQYYWIDMAPWALFTPLAAALPRRSDEEERLDTLAWCWIAAIVVFFSLSTSKRSPYILPVAPAVALLASGLFERLLGGNIERWRKRAVYALFGAIGLALGGTAAVLSLRVLPRYPGGRVAILALCSTLLAGALAIAVGLASRRRGGPLAGLVVALSALYLVTATVVLPAADPYKSARPFCRDVDALAGPRDAVVSWDLWRWRASYTFYAKHPIQNLKSIDALRRIWNGPERAFVIVEEPGLAGARAVLGSAAPVVTRRIGQTTVFAFANPATISIP